MIESVTYAVKLGPVRYEVALNLRTDRVRVSDGKTYRELPLLGRVANAETAEQMAKEFAMERSS